MSTSAGSVRHFSTLSQCLDLPKPHPVSGGIAGSDLGMPNGDVIPPSVVPLAFNRDDFVLGTLHDGNSSLRSASGTLNLAMVSSKSLQKATHSLSVILRCSWDSRMARPVYFCGPPVAQQTISVT